MDRRERQAEQRAKYAAMSRPRKVAMLLASIPATGASALAASYLVSGELRWTLAAVVGLAVPATMAFMHRDAW